MDSLSEIFSHIPSSGIKFLLVVLFSLLMGMEQRRQHLGTKDRHHLMGTDRTYALIGVLGFVFYIIAPDTLLPFLVGGAVLGVLMAVFYYQRIQFKQKFEIIPLVIALIAYGLAPLIFTQPSWLVILILVIVLVITELKEELFSLSKKFDNNEFVTLAKFLAIAGVVLPLLPDAPISQELNVSPYRFWLAIVAVSCISYVSYLLRKFVFPNSGLVLTGILGGLYSSTATTIILARKSREVSQSKEVTAAIILATTMMYIRIFLLALFFNSTIAMNLLPSFLVFIIVSIGIALYLLKFNSHKGVARNNDITIQQNKNPLEFKMALVFAVLFILFSFITGLVNEYYGAQGIKVLSFVVGVTDIDPFLLNLFQGKWDIDISVLVTAILIAVSSNNVLKLIYGLVFGSTAIRKPLIIGFSVLIVLGFLWATF